MKEDPILGGLVQATLCIHTQRILRYWPVHENYALGWGGGRYSIRRQHKILESDFSFCASKHVDAQNKPNIFNIMNKMCFWINIRHIRIYHGTVHISQVKGYISGCIPTWKGYIFEICVKRVYGGKNKHKSEKLSRTILENLSNLSNVSV